MNYDINFFAASIKHEANLTLLFENANQNEFLNNVKGKHRESKLIVITFN